MENSVKVSGGKWYTHLSEGTASLSHTQAEQYSANYWVGLLHWQNLFPNPSASLSCLSNLLASASPFPQFLKATVTA